MDNSSNFLKNNIAKYYLILVFISLSGCATDAFNTSAINSSSKYSPKLNTDSDIDKHIAIISNDSRSPVADERGSYYFDTKNGLIEKAFLNVEDGEEVKKALQKGTGLMLPVYRIQNNRKYSLESSPGPEVIVDLAASRKRWVYLTEKLKLKLLPFSATEKFDETLIRISLQQNSPLPNWYYNGFSHVVKQTGYKPDYLIDNGLVQERFRLGPISKDLSNANAFAGGDVNYVYFNYYNSLVTDTNYIAILPMRVYDQMTSGRVYINSICQLINVNDYKYLQNEFSSKTSALATLDAFLGKKNGSARNIEKVFWKKYQATMNSQGSYDGELERFCEIGLRALGLTGRVISSSLE
jgi:hypothetical protein